jgi:hypothetical protein
MTQFKPYAVEIRLFSAHRPELFTEKIHLFILLQKLIKKAIENKDTEKIFKKYVKSSKIEEQIYMAANQSLHDKQFYTFILNLNVEGRPYLSDKFLSFLKLCNDLSLPKNEIRAVKRLYTRLVKKYCQIYNNSKSRETARLHQITTDNGIFKGLNITFKTMEEMTPIYNSIRIVNYNLKKKYEKDIILIKSLQANEGKD